MNQDAQDMALYAGIGGAGLVGGNLAYKVAADKISVGREMRAEKKALEAHAKAKEAIDKSVMSRLITRGR